MPTDSLIERQALANVVAAVEDSLAELNETLGNTVAHFEGAADAPAPSWADIEKADQLRTALERATDIARNLV